MKRWVYWTIAAALILPTIPMYRYIFARARDIDRQPLPAVQAVDMYRAPPIDLGNHPMRASRRRLLAGEECHGGYVFLVSGNAYSQATDSTGRAVPCDGFYYVQP